MKHFLLIFCCVLGCTNGSFAQKKIQRVVILGLDGLSVPGLNTAKHPHIDSLFADGILSLSTRPVMPSVTLPNWTSHLTGSGPEEHGVVANDWTLAKHSLKAIATDTDGYYPSLFQLLKQQVKNIKIGYYYNWAELIHSMNKKYLDEISFEEKDGYKENYNKAVRFMKQQQQNPVLIFLYSVHTDHAGHAHKWMSPEYITAIEQADEAIGGMAQQLKAADLYDNSYFLLITDHGGNPATGHGGVSMDEMQVPWAIRGPKVRRLNPANFYNSNKNTAWVIARIFGIKKLPECWTGQVPKGIFK